MGGNGAREGKCGVKEGRKDGRCGVKEGRKGGNALWGEMGGKEGREQNGRKVWGEGKRERERGKEAGDPQDRTKC